MKRTDLEQSDGKGAIATTLWNKVNGPIDEINRLKQTTRIESSPQQSESM